MTVRRDALADGEAMLGRAAEAGRRTPVTDILVFLCLSFAAAAFGALFEPGEWYAGLNKPELTPPDQVFAPVWTVLYVCIAVSGAMVWRERGLCLAMVLWGLQLVLNAAWSWIFFGLHEPGWAFAEIRLLWLAIAATIVAFWRIRTSAALLLLPYLLWVSFASWLNYMLWRLNGV